MTAIEAEVEDGDLVDDPPDFGVPGRVWNTPIDLSQAVADFFAQEGLYWADPCSNEGSILTPNISVLLPTDERKQVFALGVKKGVFIQLGENHFADAERPELEYLLADGLALDWDDLAGGLYVNPPYGYAGTKGCANWVRRAAVCQRATVLMLLPSKTETKVFQDIIFPTCDALNFLKGRLVFLGAPDPAKFPSALIYWGSNAPAFQSFFSKFGKGLIQP